MYPYLQKAALEGNRLCCDAAVCVLVWVLQIWLAVFVIWAKCIFFQKQKKGLIKSKSTLSEEIILLQVTLQFSDSLIGWYRKSIDYQVTRVATEK